MLTDASLQEIVWTVAMLPGFGLSLYNVWGACGDLHRHWHDGYRAMGWIGLVKAMAVLLMATLILISGAVAMTTPDPIRPEVIDAANLISVCLLVIDFLVLVMAVALAVERGYVVPRTHPGRAD